MKNSVKRRVIYVEMEEHVMKNLAPKLVVRVLLVILGDCVRMMIQM